MGAVKNFIGRAEQVNWFAVAALLFTVAMFVTILSPVPDFYVMPFGFTALVCAVFNLNWVLIALLKR